MDEASGFELSLLEGMDEGLLTRLHRAGVRTREELGARIVSVEGRRALASEVGVSVRRLEVLHHLNYLLPEDRAAKVLELERRLDDRFDYLSREVRNAWRLALGLGLAIVLLVVGAVVLLRPPSGVGGGSAAVLDSVLTRLHTDEARIAALTPLATHESEGRLAQAISALGPAPGWNGPLAWSASDSRELSLLLGPDEKAFPERAVSLALVQLGEVENAPLDSLGPGARARRAASLLADFPSPGDPVDAWSAAAVLVRERLRSRALGLAPADTSAPALAAADPWPWTSPGFLTAEELIARLESLPVSPDAFPVWTETLVQLRNAADAGQTALAGRPQALARDYWIRRAELELAVVGALLGRGDLLPYHQSAPRDFLIQRRTFLANATEHAPGAARAPLLWLWVRYDEGADLLAWLEAHPETRAAVRGKTWVQALEAVEEERNRGSLAPDPQVASTVRRALAASGVGKVADPWSAARTRWEAGLAPLLMIVRAAARTRPGASPTAP